MPSRWAGRWYRSRHLITGAEHSALQVPGLFVLTGKVFVLARARDPHTAPPRRCSKIPSMRTTPTAR